MSVGKIAALAASVSFCAFSQAAGAAVIIETLAAPSPTLSSVYTGITGNTHRAGENRLFMTRKNGLITAYDQSTGIYSTFQDLTARIVGSSSDERGLLGLTFDPDYASNGQYYVYLTGRTVPNGPIEAQVIRFTDPLIAAAPEQAIWKLDLDGATNHVGGWIDFDASGKLLISIGDGGNGSAADIRGTGQNPADWFGSILRIDPHGDDFVDPTLNYAIPGDNPAIPGGRDELFVYGVRNPFRNTIAPDGNLIVADVGQDAREELTIVEAGSADRNLGWALREGDIAAPPPGGGSAPADYQAPDLVYDHSQGAAIIGGFVYRGSAVPELFGKYVFGDEVSGNIWAIGYANGAFTGSKTLLGNLPYLVGFGETVDGEIIATRFSFGSTALYQLGSDGVRPAVPEPASWAMLIGGFAMAGGALRRRSGFQLGFQAARRMV